MEIIENERKSTRKKPKYFLQTNIIQDLKSNQLPATILSITKACMNLKFVQKYIFSERVQSKHVHVR